MAKKTNPGQMRTKIIIKRRACLAQDKDGYPIEDWDDISAAPLPCKWQNAHGTEIFASSQYQERERAILTMRYNPRITTECRIYKMGDERYFEIVSVDDVDDRHAWLELAVERRTAA
jgi:head-tail adaptor